MYVYVCVCVCGGRKRCVHFIHWIILILYDDIFRNEMSAVHAIRTFYNIALKRDAYIQVSIYCGIFSLINDIDGYINF